MTPEQIQELIDTLLGMGETMATEAFRLATKQVQADAIVNAFWGGLLLIAAIGLLIVSYRFYRIAKPFFDKGKSYNTYADISSMLSAVFGLALLFSGIDLFSSAIRYAYNPEWYAIKEVLSLLK